LDSQRESVTRRSIEILASCGLTRMRRTCAESTHAPLRVGRGHLGNLDRPMLLARLPGLARYAFSCLVAAASLCVVAAAIVLPAGARSASQETASRPLYIQADRLFNGKTLISGQVAVAVRAGKVVAAGRLKIPRGVRVIRLRGTHAEGGNGSHRRPSRGNGRRREATGHGATRSTRAGGSRRPLGCSGRSDAVPWGAAASSLRDGTRRAHSINEPRAGGLGPCTLLGIERLGIGGIRSRRRG
jgi:hypothetical protein